MFVTLVKVQLCFMKTDREGVGISPLQKQPVHYGKFTIQDIFKDFICLATSPYLPKIAEVSYYQFIINSTQSCIISSPTMVLKHKITKL